MTPKNIQLVYTSEALVLPKLLSVAGVWFPHVGPDDALMIKGWQSPKLSQLETCQSVLLVWNWTRYFPLWSGPNELNYRCKYTLNFRVGCNWWSSALGPAHLCHTYKRHTEKEGMTFQKQKYHYTKRANCSLKTWHTLHSTNIFHHYSI